MGSGKLATITSLWPRHNICITSIAYMEKKDSPKGWMASNEKEEQGRDESLVNIFGIEFSCISIPFTWFI